MKTPKIKLQLTRTDWILEAIGLLGIFLPAVYLFANYNALSDATPTHYNAIGQPNKFSGKSSLFILPAVALAIYIILTIALRFPHLFNHPFEITEENAERQYKNMTLLVRILKTLIVAIVLYLTFASIQNGLGKMHGLGAGFLPLTLITVFGTVVVFIYKGYKLQ